MNVLLRVTAGPHAGKEFRFNEHENFIVGRASCAHFRLPQKDRYFSRVHFMLEVNPPECRLMDMGSRNGTYVNDQSVSTIDLKDGDVIRGGRTEIRVSFQHDDDSSPSFETEIVEKKAIFGSMADPGPSAPVAETPSRLSIPVPKVTPSIPGLENLPPNVLKLLPPDFEKKIQEFEQSIPGYWLVDELGKGGMGVVFLAIRKQDLSVVALKTIAPSGPIDEKEIDRFLREAEILQSLNHPNIVRFRDMGEVEGLLFFGMDYVPGIDALTLVQESDELLPIRRAVGIACQLLSALSFAHEKGFVHRDIKPANLLLTQVEGRGIVKLADFGLARTYETSRISGLTMMGETGGTVPFMAPEQITNYRDAKPSVDQYSAAATLYYMLTKKCVHDFPPEISGQLLKIMQENTVPIRERRPEISRELADVIHRALDREPERRFADANAFRDALLPSCQ